MFPDLFSMLHPESMMEEPSEHQFAVFSSPPEHAMMEFHDLGDEQSIIEVEHDTDSDPNFLDEEVPTFDDELSEIEDEFSAHQYEEAVLESHEAGDDNPELGQSADVGAMAGTPEADRAFWDHQEGANSCGVASQKCIIEAVTGQDIPESTLAMEAMSHGWYDPSRGTSIAALGNLLELHGIPLEKKFNCSLTELYQALENGQKVLVALDANEIWTPQTGLDGTPLEQPDAGHAVWVTGIEMDEQGNAKVILNDTGHSGGAGRAVLAKDFVNAWSDFGNYAVITTNREEPQLV